MWCDHSMQAPNLYLALTATERRLMKYARKSTSAKARTKAPTDRTLPYIRGANVWTFYFLVAPDVRAVTCIAVIAQKTAIEQKSGVDVAHP